MYNQDELSFKFNLKLSTTKANGITFGILANCKTLQFTYDFPRKFFKQFNAVRKYLTFYKTIQFKIHLKQLLFVTKIVFID